MNIHYDTLKQEYLDAITSLDKLCFSIPWSKNLFASELASSLAHYVLALDGESVVGYCGIQSVAGEGSITNIAVAPAYRNRGIASKLLEQIIDYGRAHKLDFITLEVRESNTSAINLYTKYGFELVGSRKGYYADNHETALLMTKILTQ
ncbi:MAG: ribosomal protein S18-alanine N-acetyltransferase [Clostridia bacterium]|nr:ribosomal protein S18-alanine N-acetyltransferase [Clostridia bacterium]